jgi:hypothetical protein
MVRKRDLRKIPGANRFLSEALSVIKFAKPKVKKLSEDLGISQSALQEKSYDLAAKAKHSAAELSPKVSEALEGVKDYATEHETELKKGASESAKVASKMLTPPLLRPALDAFLNEVKSQDELSEKAEDDSTP